MTKSSASPCWWPPPSSSSTTRSGHLPWYVRSITLYTCSLLSPLSDPSGHVLPLQPIMLTGTPSKTTALCRCRSPPARRLPPSRLGHPHPCDPHPAWFRRCRLLPIYGHDQEQQEEGRQGQSRGLQEEGVDDKWCEMMNKDGRREAGRSGSPGESSNQLQIAGYGEGIPEG